MKTQQAAEREEQLRIKNLVLNYDLHDGEDQDGEFSVPSLHPNRNIHNFPAGIDKAAATNHTRPDKSQNNRSGQRARKLQLSDVDWYGKNKSLKPPSAHPSENKNTQSLAHPPNSRPRKPLGGEFLPNIAPPRDLPVQIPTSQTVRKTGRGKLSRKEILKEHASRNSTIES